MSGATRWCKLIAGVLVLALLVACATKPAGMRPEITTMLAGQLAREAEIAASSEWSFSGRVAVRSDGQGGSGRIEWRQRGDDFEITLSAPISRQGWRLVRQAGRARLEGLDGGPREGGDAEMLLREATGWVLPVSAMSDWLRGGRDGETAEVEFSAAGLPRVVIEHGWRIEFREWHTGSPSRPRRIFADHSGGGSVRLVIEQWSVP